MEDYVMENGAVTAVSNQKVFLGFPTVNERRGYLFLKRVFDIFCSLIAGVVLFVPMLVIGLLVGFDSPGSVIFKQERLGQFGKPFYIYKFRTMREDAETDGPRWAEKDDERCTRVGRFLRRTRLDELPQIWNILKGDMTLVGPRPERAYFYDKFEAYIPGFRNRLLVKPGLTGLAQTNGGYDLLPEEKIVYDMRYIANRSFIWDMKLVIKTIKLVFTQEGAR